MGVLIGLLIKLIMVNIYTGNPSQMIDMFLIVIVELWLKYGLRKVSNKNKNKNIWRDFVHIEGGGV